MVQQRQGARRRKSQRGEIARGDELVVQNDIVEIGVTIEAAAFAPEAPKARQGVDVFQPRLGGIFAVQTVQVIVLIGVEKSQKPQKIVDGNPDSPFAGFVRKAGQAVRI